MRPNRWRGVLPTLTALVGAAILAAAFALELVAFRRALLDDARHELERRTALLADTLSEPLASGDFRSLHAVAATLHEDGFRLLVLSGEHGVYFDSQPRGEEFGAAISAEHPAAGLRVRLAWPLKRVMEPFDRARRGFVLAALMGAAGFALVFAQLFRQRWRIRELKRLEEFRRTFIADVSHELKTPLAGIAGAMEMLGERRAELPADSARLVELAAHSARRLDVLVRSILDLSRLERETVAVASAEFDLAELVRSTVAELSPAASAAGVELTVAAPAALAFRGDDAMLARALGNLVRNALVHSGSRAVAVTLTAAAKAVEIAVEDHGVGIPAADRARIFERFYRVDRSRTAATGGSGLGLAIVRRIAELHGGTAEFAPADPHGARFTLRLPR